LRRPGRATLDAHPESTIGLPLADGDLTLGKSFLWATRGYADREALVFSGRRYTYRELEAEVVRCARALIAAKVSKGTRVGVLMGARPEFLVLCYAVALVGGINVMISTFAQGEDLDWIVRHSDTALLVMHEGIRGHDVAGGFSQRHPDLGTTTSGVVAAPEFPFLGRIVVVPTARASEGSPFGSWDDFLSAGATVDASVVFARKDSVKANDDAMLLYTSGSTGYPKGVLHSHRAPVMQGFNMADCMAIGPSDRTWTSFPTFWTAGWVTGIAAPLSVGAAIILQESYEPTEAQELIAAERVTSVRQMIHDEMRLVAAHEANPLSLESVTVGVVTDSLRQITRVPYEITEICGWGMTETFTNATMLPFDAPFELRQTTMGRPVPGDFIRIRDFETGEALPPNQLGEITVSGMSLMSGYYKQDPLLPVDSAGYLPTNDSGYLTEAGYLIFAGRTDRLIKTAGVNVAPIEIEERLQQWGRLGTTAVVGVPHPSLGAVVVLCAVSKPDDRVDVDEIKAYLRTHLASYKTPRYVLFFSEDELPLTISSKVQIGPLGEQVKMRLLQLEIDPAWRDTLEKH
jgi:acyl-CoA synthetase (AMP-forming)/AMP-acid ligase II